MGICRGYIGAREYRGMGKSMKSAVWGLEFNGKLEDEMETRVL